MGRLASEMQLLAKHIGRYQRQARLGHSKSTLAVCIMILANHCAIFNSCSTIDNGAIDAAILANTDVGQDY